VVVQDRVSGVVDQHPRPQWCSPPPPDVDREAEAELMGRLEDEDQMGQAADDLRHAVEDLEEEPGCGVARVEEAGVAARERLRAAAQVHPGAGDGVPVGGPRR
jgi:hypothetical protein